MKSIISTAATAAVLLLAISCNSDRYRICGTVEDESLNGVQVFLVPIHDQSHEAVDSVFIKDGKFTFKGDKHQISEIRIDRRRRIGTQNLLIITEPGTINVKIGAVSSCSGTPQNDSLQIWKEMTDAKNDAIFATKDIDKRRAIQNEYKEKTKAFAKTLEDGLLREFLTTLYPLDE